MEKNTKIILWGVGILSAFGLGFLIYKNVNKQPNKQSKTDENKPLDNSSKIDELKANIKTIEAQLSTAEMSKKWGQADYVALQNKKIEYAKQLGKLGWKSIQSQQKDGSFLQIFEQIPIIL